jgi:hypothetical protein
MKEDSERQSGSDYELAIQLGGADTKRLGAALAGIWSSRLLAGPWADRAHTDPVAEPRVERDGAQLLRGQLLVGTDWLQCSLSPVREPGAEDWLYLGVTLGELGHWYDVELPLERATNPWIQELETAFVGVATDLYELVPFVWGLIGDPCYGAPLASHTSPSALVDSAQFTILLPDGAGSELGVPVEWAVHGGGLSLFVRGG